MIPDLSLRNSPSLLSPKSKPHPSFDSSPVSSQVILPHYFARTLKHVSNNDVKNKHVERLLLLLIPLSQESIFNSFTGVRPHFAKFLFCLFYLAQQEANPSVDKDALCSYFSKYSAFPELKNLRHSYTNEIECAMEVKEAWHRNKFDIFSPRKSYGIQVFSSLIKICENRGRFFSAKDFSQTANLFMEEFMAFYENHSDVFSTSKYSLDFFQENKVVGK